MASKRRLRRNACGNKIRYADQTEAVVASIKIKRLKNDHMSCYRCRFCGYWHLGHRKGTQTWP